MFKDDRRFGKFFINIECLNNNIEAIQKIMGLCIILRAEMMLARDVIEYEAWCPLFELLDPGLIVPTYTFTINGDTGELTVET